MARDRQIVVQVIGDSSSLERSFKRSESAARGFDRSMGQTIRGTLAGSGAIRGLGRSLAFASAGFLSAAGTVTLIRSSIKAASDLTEEISKANVVFRGSERQVAEWSEHLSSAFGLTRGEALRTASTLGNMLVPMGFVRRDAAKMSETLVELAGDMASFNNASPDDVLQALQSALAGAVRPLRRFGVFLTQDRILAEAFADGIAKTTLNVGKIADANTKVAIAQAKLTAANAKYGAGTTQVAEATVTLHSAQAGLHKALEGSSGVLTTAQKTLATYKLVLKDTADAQGNAANSAGTLAGQLRTQHAEIGNLKERIGQELLPAELSVLRVTNDWISQSKNQERVQRDVREAVHALGEAVKVAGEIIGAATPIIKGVVAAFGGLKNTLEVLAAVIAGFKLAGLIRSFGLLGAAAGAGGAAGEVSLLRRQLLLLRAVGVISIGIELALNRKAIDKFVNEKLPAALSFSGSDLIHSIVGGKKPETHLGGIPAFGGTSALNRIIEVGKAQTAAANKAAAARTQAAKDVADKIKAAATATGGGGGLRVGTSAADRASKANQIFDDAISRALDRVQDIPTLKAQLKRLGEIAKIVQDRINITKDITRRLTLSDTLVGIFRQQKTDREQIAQGFRDALFGALEFKLTKAEVTASLNDNLQVLGEIQKAIRAEIKKQGETLDLRQQLFDNQQQIAAARLSKVTGRQFLALGLSTTGDARVPGKTSLNRQLGTITEAVKGTFLDTTKTKTLLAGVRQNLTEALVPKEVRSKMKELLDDLNQQLKDHVGERTKFAHVSSNSLLAGLGLSRDELRAVRAQLGQIGAGGIAPGRTAQFSAAGGRGGVVFAGPVTNHFHGVEDMRGFEEQIERRARSRVMSRRSG